MFCNRPGLEFSIYGSSFPIERKCHQISTNENKDHPCHGQVRIGFSNLSKFKYNIDVMCYTAEMEQNWSDFFTSTNILTLWKANPSLRQNHAPLLSLHTALLKRTVTDLTDILYREVRGQDQLHNSDPGACTDSAMLKDGSVKRRICRHRNLNLTRAFEGRPFQQLGQRPLFHFHFIDPWRDVQIGR